jgi:peptide/nickel transport system permease protein
LHILPNIVPELLVTASLGFASAVMSEAGLSYLGLGMQPPNPSFGKMLSEAQNYILQAWWYVLIPSVAISLLVMGFNLLGDGLQSINQQ